ncbi:hypothetical protein [Holospora curviuscula]|uniref:Uncharacterized protein n=1 Tax=Holospora curviuscula TaxID=1082868 RepID=A0A2S5RE40_9PROT|nr:hypothetical protein HCUR_00216 [Holospora curviuscula]
MPITFLAKNTHPKKQSIVFIRAPNIKESGKNIGELVNPSSMKLGRHADPSYSVIDFQSVQTTESAEERGVDGGKNKRSETLYCNRHTRSSFLR